MTQRLLAKNLELQTHIDEVQEDRNSYRGDYGILATQRTVLENQLAQSQRDLKAKCQEVEIQSELEAKCFELESSLIRSERLRRDEDSERKALSFEAGQADSKIKEADAMWKLKLLSLKADYWEELNQVKEQRDEAIAAVPKNSSVLRKELKAKDNEMDLLRVTQKAQTRKLRAKLHKAASHIEQLELKLDLDSSSKQLHHRILEEPVQELAASKTQEEADIVAPANAKDEELEEEIKGLKISLDSQAKAIRGYQSQIEELKETIKAQEAVQTGHPELTSLENTGDQASQDQDPPVDASEAAANQGKIEELERLLKAEIADHKDLKSSQLEKNENQLAEIKQLQNMITLKDVDLTTLRREHQADLTSQQDSHRVLLQAKDEDLERIHAQHLEECQSQRLKIKSLEDDRDVKDIVMGGDDVLDHVCDRSQCINQKNLQEAQISELTADLMGRNLKVDRHRTEAGEQGMKMEGLKAQLEDEKAVTQKLRRSVEKSDRDWAQLRGSLQLGEEHDLASVERLLGQWQANSASQNHQCDHSACDRRFLAKCDEISALGQTLSSLRTKFDDRELNIKVLTADLQTERRKANNEVKKNKAQVVASAKAMEDEKAARQKAVEAERTMAFQRFQADNPLRGEAIRLKRALDDMTANRDKCRAANETYRMASLEARKKVDAAEEASKAAAAAAKCAQHLVEKERDELAKAVEELKGKLSGGMVEVEEEEPAEGGSRGETSRKRPHDGDEDPRPPKILRDQY